MPIIIILFLESFSYQRQLMVFQWRDRKSFQVSRILLSILTDFNEAVNWMISTCPLISKSFYFFTNPLEILLSSPITTDITDCFKVFFLILLQRQILIPLFSNRCILEFFPPVLANGFSLEFERQHVSITFCNSNDATLIYSESTLRVKSLRDGKKRFIILWYLSLTPTRQDWTQCQKPEGRLKWE